MHTPTPLLCGKSSQTIENERRHSKKERQEKPRGGKSMEKRIYHPDWAGAGTDMESKEELRQLNLS
jgi:hypothetical protein